MSLFKHKPEPARLHPKPDHMHLEETLVAISPILVVVMVFILLVLAAWICGPVFSTEANRYEHLEEIVLCTKWMVSL